MESCCRVCSRSDEFRRFSLYAVAEVSQEVIANMIRDTSDTQISSEDGLPQHICPDCLMTLSLAYSFRKQCRRSDAKFREYWGGRTPQSIEQQQQQQQLLPRLSQSQTQDDNSFEAVTTIKEEVDIYDYEYSIPSNDNEWVIQNPRTIGEGAMTVVHNTGQYYDEANASAIDASVCDRDGNVIPMMAIHQEAHDPAELGESSGLAQKGEKWKKKPPTPERYSQRIRRQSEELGDEGGEFLSSDAKVIEVLKTSRGKDLLALDGYAFYKYSQRGNRCYWECKGRNRNPEVQMTILKCPARVTTDYFDDKHKLVSYRGNHTHAADSTQIQEIKQRNLFKECSISEGAKPCKSLDAVEVPMELARSFDGAPFFQASVNAEMHTALIFVTSSDLKHLVNAKYWLLTSTFSAGIKLQQQIIIIHGSLGPYHQQMSPFVYILASASHELLYRQIFSKLKEMAQSMELRVNPQLILTDLEKPLVNSLEAEFPHTMHSACFFHVTNQMFRSAKKYGLEMSFDKNNLLLQSYKRLKALAYLPPEHIPGAFYVLKADAPLEMHRFLADFAENYIFGKVAVNTVDGAMQNRPMFPATVWSVHANITQSVPTTYSYNKEWHYRMTRILTAYHSEPHNVFRAFQHEQQESQRKLVGLVEGRPLFRRTAEDQRNEDIHNVAMNFTRYPTLEFLDSIAVNLDGEAV